jgi:hypothetical protein
VGFGQIWLPAGVTLRNFFYAPTVEMKITFDLLRQVRNALYQDEVGPPGINLQASLKLPKATASPLQP